MIYTVKSEIDEQNRTWYRVHGREPFKNNVWEDQLAYGNRQHALERLTSFRRAEYLDRISPRAA